jgi:hypothetical protein
LFRLFGIPREAANFDQRGFPSGPARRRLERVGETFIDGYNFALTRPEGLDDELAGCAPELRGFLAEGATMGAAVRAAFAPWRDDLGPLLTALKPRFVHLSHVGAGWAMARLPFARRRIWRRLDAVLAPLALDGWGFHDGYFHPVAALRQRSGRRYFSAQSFDQGLGRSLWFACCANADQIKAAIASAGGERANDLWAGVGLACAYAGGASQYTLGSLHAAAGPSRSWLGQGAAFALAAHHRAGIMPPHTETSVRRFCATAPGLLVHQVERERQAAVRKVGAGPGAYAEWRRAIASLMDKANR